MSTNILFTRKDTSLSPQAPSGSSSRGRKRKMAFLLSDPNNSKNHHLATQAAKKKGSAILNQLQKRIKQTHHKIGKLQLKKFLMMMMTIHLVFSLEILNISLKALKTMMR